MTVRALAPEMGFCLPLVAGVRTRVAPRREVVVPLGSIPLNGADLRGVFVVLELARIDGKAIFAVGTRWPGEAAVWSDTEYRAEERGYAVPLRPDRDAESAQVEVFVRLRTGFAAAAVTVSAFVQLPWGMT